MWRQSMQIAWIDPSAALVAISRKTVDRNAVNWASDISPQPIAKLV
jgi:hypothetical protein